MYNITEYIFVQYDITYPLAATCQETYWLDVAQDVNTTLAHIDWLDSSGWITEQTTEARPIL